MKKNLVVLITCFVLLFVSVNTSRAAFIMHKPATAAAAIAPAANNENNVSISQAAEEHPASAPAKDGGSKSHTGKSQLVALLLCIFLGGLGIHRFYLGYIGAGIIQLFTGGGFGIWWFIDLIRIILGDLKPKDGDYGSTF